mgnify:CR=1 FL=1
MPEFLEVTVDKFTFKVATDRVYSREGVWALAEGNRVRIGLSDFLQQRSGDIAFAEIKPAGTLVALARFNHLGAVAVLGRHGGFWRVTALTD